MPNIKIGPLGGILNLVVLRKEVSFTSKLCIYVGLIDSVYEDSKSGIGHFQINYFVICKNKLQ